MLSLDWDRRRRVTPGETTSQEAWPGAELLGPTSHWREPRWSADRRARPARRALHWQVQHHVCVYWRSAFLMRLTLPSVAQSPDRDGAGHHRLCPLTKIGVESETRRSFYCSFNINPDAGASRERDGLPKDDDAWRALTILSCPAKAGHPVITDARAKSPAAAITGSSAFADDDKKREIAPARSASRGWRGAHRTNACK